MASEGSSARVRPVGGEARSPAEVAAENERLRAEVERLRAENRASARTRRRGVRRAATGVLVVLTSVSVLASTVAVWTHRTAFDTGRFVALLQPVAENPQVTDRLGAYLTEQVFTGLDVRGRVEAALARAGEALPNRTGLADNLTLLAAPITTAAHNLIRERVNAFLRSDAFQRMWTQLLTTAHQKVVALLRADYAQTPNLRIEGDVVTLNLIPPIVQVLTQLVQRGVNLIGLDVTIPQIRVTELPAAAIERLDSALGVSLPANFGQVPIMSTATLHSLQQAATRFDRLVWALLALTVALLIATLVLSLSRRRTLIQLGIGVTLAILLAAVAIRVLQDRILSAISDPGTRGAAREVIATALGNLRAAGILVVAIALVVGVVSYLAGRPRWVIGLAARLRGSLASTPRGSDLERLVERRFDWFVVGGAALALLVLFAVGVSWLSLLVVGALLALYVWGLVSLRQRARAHTAPAAPVAPA